MNKTMGGLFKGILIFREAGEERQQNGKLESKTKNHHTVSESYGN